MIRKKTVRRGRPRLAKEDRRRNITSVRLRDETQKRLVSAAETSGRSISQEAEYRIETSFFQRRDKATAAILQIIAAVIDTTDDHGGRLIGHMRNGPKAHWLTDPYLFDQVASGITELFQTLRPAGDIERPQWPDDKAHQVANQLFATLSERMAFGRGYMFHILRAIRDDEDWPQQSRINPRELAAALGDDLIDRLKEASK